MKLKMMDERPTGPTISKAPHGYLPLDFVRQMSLLLGEAEVADLECALQEEPSTSIRLNPAKLVEPSNASPYINKVPWCNDGRYLSERPQFTFDPLLHAGCYYVQEASSMFVSQAIRQYVGTSAFVLDLCAAPGGKSTLLRSSLPEGSVLVCNEIMRNRAQILAENMIKWGYPDIMVTNNASEDFSECSNCFDLILADVPCSGEGMFRKDDEAISCWSLENVQMCAERQRHLINNIWPALKPGGILIYSTCTYNAEEDERNVSWIMQEFGASVLPIKVPEGCDVMGNLIGGDYPVYHFMQHKVKGEGFFMAVIRKPDEPGFRPFHLPNVSAFEKDKKKKKDKKQVSLPVKEILSEVQQWILNPDNYYWQVTEEGVRALPLSMASFYLWGQKNGLKILEAGAQVATLKGKEPIPTHALAMSTQLNTDAFVCHEATYAQAISYLRKESVVLSSDVPKGYVLLTYRKIPIGFVKNLGNRANNLYPQEWRIRSSYIPEKFDVI